MASSVAVLLLVSAGLFTVGFGDDDNYCFAYFTSDHEYKPSINCHRVLGLVSQHCCGDCDNRFCCPFNDLKLTAPEQFVCNIQNSDVLIIVLGIIGTVVTCIVFIACCCCPCCCMYNMCRKPRPVAGAHITTVMNTQSIQQQQQQQPVMQPAQYPAYQPVPTQPGYGAQPMQTGPYPGQPYAPGPPPSYNMAANPGYPTVQAPYDRSQATYLMMPPAQPGSAYPAPE
ncbi:protein shisa-5-like [Siphateles boraxobius]|uniref:protein shisa-5-like n=1 Tax=Siphateles boraxobius TaxID=180520 RepID=UPI004063BCA4